MSNLIFKWQRYEFSAYPANIIIKKQPFGNRPR